MITLESQINFSINRFSEIGVNLGGIKFQKDFNLTVWCLKSRFKALDKPHADVHNYGKMAIDLAKESKMQDCIAYLNKMEKSSVDVIHSLEALSKS